MMTEPAPEFAIDALAPDGLAALERLYPAAFPQEDLLPLVRRLLAPEVGALSLAARAAGDLVGHAFFTPCGLNAAPCALLGPLAVAPAHQRRGVGGALIREGLARLEAQGVAHVFVLGDPAYYGRFGFAPTAAEPPCPIPGEWRDAWRSLALGDAPPAEGRLVVPPPWRDPALWAG